MHQASIRWMPLEPYESISARSTRPHLAQQARCSPSSHPILIQQANASRDIAAQCTAGNRQRPAQALRSLPVLTIT